MSKKTNNLRKRIAKLEAELAAERAKPGLKDILSGRFSLTVGFAEYPKCVLKEMSIDEVPPGVIKSIRTHLKFDIEHDLRFYLGDLFKPMSGGLGAVIANGSV